MALYSYRLGLYSTGVLHFPVFTVFPVDFILHAKRSVVNTEVQGKDTKTLQGVLPIVYLDIVPDSTM